jgi:hypothetical protein
MRVKNHAPLSTDPFAAPAPPPTLPTSDDVAGVYTVETNEGPITVTGWIIGLATTERVRHVDHTGVYAAKGERCFACRWSETYVYRVLSLSAEDVATLEWPRADLPRYIVVSVGGTSVPGETTYRRVAATSSGFEVVELLTMRKSGQDPYMPAVSSRTLSQAADRDETIREAFVNRAVV